MNIETKRFHVRSTGIAGQVEIMNKATRECAYVHANRLPSVNAIAGMHERTLDRLLEGF